MKRPSSLPAALAVLLALGGCVDEGPTPVEPASPRLDPSPSYARSPARTGRQVVVLREGRTADLRRLVARHGGTLLREYPAIGVAVTRGLSAAAVAELERNSAVQGVDADVRVQWVPPRQQVVRRQISAPATLTDQSGAFFFDEFQWNIRQIRADDAWLSTPQGAGATVAILDSGIDPDHIDLAGKVDLARSTSCSSTEADILDRNFHGTAVAGIVSTNGIGVASVAPDASLVAVKVLDATGSGSFDDIICGIVYAGEKRFDVANLSLGAYFPVDSRDAVELILALTRAINYATSRGVLVVASAGNEGVNLDRDGNWIHVPSQLLFVQSVGATAPHRQQGFDQLATYSNYGRTGVDVVAPGGDLLEDGFLEDLIISPCSSLVCGDPASYLLWSGTSAAAPHAAGAAAVTESARPGNQPGIALGLCTTLAADDIGRRGADPLYGWGRVDVPGAARCRPT